jgi:hypothetical protein
VTDVPYEVESDLEESECAFPPPVASGDESCFMAGFPARAAEPEPIVTAKPSWWTNPWSLLEEESSPRNVFLAYKAMCPAQFKNERIRDVTAIDAYGSQLASDRSGGGDGNELYHDVTGAIWDDELVMISRVSDKGVSQD